MQCLERLPRLSPMMTQLLARLSGRNCDVRELTEIVERDPVLSAQVLQLANSAIFARLRQVSSVRHAVSMVGIGAMRKFVLGSSISNLFSRAKPAPSFSMVRFNLHSVATAVLLEQLAAVVPFESAEDAFLAGLLHDIGKLLIAVSMPREYEDIQALAAGDGRTLIECEREVLGIDHAELSGMAVCRWELSKAIQTSAAQHHQPEEADSMERRSQKAALSMGVNRADAFVNHLGMSVLQAPVAPEAPGEPPPLEIPGFTFSQQKVLDAFGEEVKNLGSLFR